MSDSIAARQEALLRQNAALNERVVALDERHRLQQERVEQSQKVVEETLIATEPRPSFAKEYHERNVGDEDLVDSSSTYPADEKDTSEASAVSPQSMMNRNDHESSQEEAKEHKSRPARGSSSRSSRHRSNAAQPPKGEYESPEMEDTGNEATLRYQKTRIRVLQGEMDKAKEYIEELESNNSRLNHEMEQLQLELAATSKKNAQTTQLLQKQKELVSTQEERQRLLETQLSTARSRIEELERAEKQSNQQLRSKDVRLNRALEDLEKTKQLLQQVDKDQTDQMIRKADYDAALAENKKLEKQKNDLLLAFKKQLKLIDLLKRQRIHMEAAKMLSFTEQEFSKTLELN